MHIGWAIAAGTSLSALVTGAAITIITDDQLRAPMNSPVAEAAPVPIPMVVVNRDSRGDRNPDIFGERWVPEPAPKPDWIPPRRLRALRLNPPASDLSHASWLRARHKGQVAALPSVSDERTPARSRPASDPSPTRHHSTCRMANYRVLPRSP